ncbi:MAG: hypothetical protein ACRCYR_03625 [Phycicoccus sp.]
MKRAFAWALWSKQRTAAVGSALGVALLVAVIVSLAAAGDDSNSTQGSSRSDPTQSRTLPTPTIVIPTLPTPSVNSRIPGIALAAGTPESAADGFMKVWLSVREVKPEAWRQQLSARSTGAEMKTLIRDVPAQMIPRAQVVSARPVSVSAARAEVAVVITNAETYTVTLTRDKEGVWLVTSADPHGGDA